MLKEKKGLYHMVIYKPQDDGLWSIGRRIGEPNNRGSENIPIHFILWPHKYETMLWISFEYQKERRSI